MVRCLVKGCLHNKDASCIAEILDEFLHYQEITINDRQMCISYKPDIEKEKEDLKDSLKRN